MSFMPIFTNIDELLSNLWVNGVKIYCSIKVNQHIEHQEDFRKNRMQKTQP